jgi:hypothetical protein
MIDTTVQRSDLNQVTDLFSLAYVTRLGNKRTSDGQKIIRIVVMIIARRKGNIPLKILSKGTSVAMPFIT